jgi:NAD(P)-dependent dehydrogenase (short-subunit alcohol dehydrogenase family)
LTNFTLVVIFNQAIESTDYERITMKSYLLITGATGGLGSAFSLTCAQKGYDLVLTDRTSQGEAFARQLTAAYGVDVQYLPCDLTSDEARSGLFAHLAAGGMPTTEECMRAIFAQGFWGWATTVVRSG